MSVVLGAIASLAPKLLQLLKSEYDLQKNLKKRVESVHDQLENIQAALHKLSAVPWDELDEQLKIWARQIRNASYDMEDVLDTFLLRVEGGEPVNRSKLNRAMKKMGGLFGQLKARRDITEAIDDIEQKLQKAADWHTRYKVDDIVANYSARAEDPRLLDFYRKASRLVGIDEPRDELIEMLSIRKDDADASNNEVKIISIVGIGGLGKTTLAKAVYDKVYHQFDCGARVPVGCHADPRKVLRDIIIDLVNDAKKNCSSLSNSKDSLKEKRYFIVVDDIWDIETWESIKDIFVDSNPRSRIIATTRKSNVSEKFGKVYRMKKLTDIQSEILLYTRTFDGVEENSWPDKDELAVVSQKILHRCDGVPLAIVTIGSLLVGKPIKEWSNVYDSVGFSDGDDTQVNNMKKILSFGYYDLPCHLRTCMLYLGMFPEDYTVSRDKLILMWIAEGLVKQTKKEKDLVNVGDSYFIELINRGMIQPVEKFGFVTGCRVHDMVLHMIRDLSREELFLVVQEQDSSKEESQPSGIRRLALHKAKPIQVNDKDMQKVRYFNAMYCGTDMIPPVVGFKLLRVLSLVSCPLKGHLDTRYLGKLLHLRYLSLQSTPVRELPKDIGRLKFLQTLILTGTEIEELPTSLGQLTELMCLCADDKTRGPDWIGKLTSLVHLQMFFAADDKCFVKELGNLRNLRTLHTRITLQDEEQRSKQFARKDAIMQPSLFVLCCNNLRSLILDPLKFNRLPEWINPQALPKLCILSLHFSALYQQDMEIIGKFKQLCVLWINNSGFSIKFSISGGGRFQNLKCIQCHGLYQVQFVQGAMPVLEVFVLRIPVCVIKEDDFGLDFGLRNLPALQKVTAQINCSYCLPTEVVEVEAKLTHTFNSLPSRPTFKIHRVCEDRMVKSSDSEIEGQKKKSKIINRWNDKNGGPEDSWNKLIIRRNFITQWNCEVAEMGKLITNLNLSDDIRNKASPNGEQHSIRVVERMREDATFIKIVGREHCIASHCI
ncbi:unnamed protein product [Miscanthus lutarioriparius]|uniref:Uncharacterized protein n=1 Tax=Miscanthus lutarioriparius TaxID=422564 RepID=A0A811RAZ4_9POAL|nr:unnamed protein product [Miscanthus lutarioriparius]